MGGYDIGVQLINIQNIDLPEVNVIGSKYLLVF